MKTASFLKIVLVAALAVSVTGCAGIADRAIKSTWTPSLEKCEGLNGKSVADFKAQLGDPEIEPDNISTEADGSKNYTFSKGNMFAYMVVVDSKIKSVECWKDENKNPPSKRRAMVFSTTNNNYGGLK